MSQLQNCTFWENLPKNLKTYFPLMTTFYDFALKIETSWAKMDIKPSLETWNVNVIVYVWYIYSQIKKIKNMKCKKE